MKGAFYPFGLLFCKRLYIVKRFDFVTEEKKKKEGNFNILS